MHSPYSSEFHVDPTFERLSKLDEFRTLTSLVSLVQSINGDYSNPTLSAQASSSNFNGSHQHTIGDGFGRSIKYALKSVASLLVQDAEVVACTGHMNTLDNLDSVNIVALYGRPMEVTNISNSRHIDNCFEGSTPHISNARGKSYWKTISSKRWELVQK